MNNKNKLTKQDLIEMYEMMCYIRSFEYAVLDCSRKGSIIGNVHACIGQEAVAVGLIRNLNREDMLLLTHRPNAHLIAKGADINLMMAEMMGRENGSNRGRGGSMHQSQPAAGILCATGAVGSALPLGTGAGLYSALYHPGQVTMAFSGDGGGNTGAFHEGINMAAVWKLPVIFVIENNGYAISTSTKISTSSKTFSQRGAAYDIPGIHVDGNDAVAVYEAGKKAVERARAGEGPTLIECVTYRQRGHHEGDDERYRSKEEVKTWLEKCPIKRMKELLENEYAWTQADEDSMNERIDAKINAAVEYGLSGVPCRGEDVEKFVYVERADAE